LFVTTKDSPEPTFFKPLVPKVSSPQHVMEEGSKARCEAEEVPLPSCNGHGEEI
jgi:hypothetical protein